jgi:hypothetical protein
MARKTKSKLPKTIAGVKVPKALRKSGAVRRLMASPLGREILAGVMIAAAAALAKQLPNVRQIARAGGTGAAANSPARTAAGALVEVVSDAARNILGRSQPTGTGRDMAPDDENRIRQRAYAIWEREGRPEWRDQEHWDQARREIELGRASAEAFQTKL